MKFHRSIPPEKNIRLLNIETECMVVNVVNVYHVYLILNLKDKVLDSVISDDILYTVLDVENLSEGEILNTRAYRAKIQNIRIPDRKLFNTITAQFRSYTMKTNGLFRCKIIGIDKYRRLLVELYDPITGDSV